MEFQFLTCVSIPCIFKIYLKIKNNFTVEREQKACWCIFCSELGNEGFAAKMRSDGKSMLEKMIKDEDPAMSMSTSILLAYHPPCSSADQQIPQHVAQPQKQLSSTLTALTSSLAIYGHDDFPDFPEYEMQPKIEDTPENECVMCASTIDVGELGCDDCLGFYGEKFQEVARKQFEAFSLIKENMEKFGMSPKVRKNPVVQKAIFLANLEGDGSKMDSAEETPKDNVEIHIAALDQDNENHDDSDDEEDLPPLIIPNTVGGRAVNEWHEIFANLKQHEEFGEF